VGVFYSVECGRAACCNGRRVGVPAGVGYRAGDEDSVEAVYLP